MLKLISRSVLSALAVVAVVAGITPAQAASDGFSHHVVFQVSDNDPLKMNIALNNAANVTKAYAAKGEQVQIEIVVYGPGLTMAREDKSPVKDRLASYFGSFPNVGLRACGNTIKGVTKKEGKAPPIISSDNITVVSSGVVQIMERQDQNWHYIRP